MQAPRALMAVLLLAVAAYGPAATEARQAVDTSAITYTCPMAEHADVVEDKPGTCRLCQMVLVPVIIDLAWTCPVHPVVIKEGAGRCPIDRRDLVQVAVSKYWTCAGKPDERLMAKGTCADGRARAMVLEQRAHGDHNAKHGGLLFMASDRWHHIEGTHPQPGLFRLFLYDNFTRPLAAADVAGRVVTREEADVRTGVTREVEATPLRRGRDGSSLQARLGQATLPARLVVKLRFSAKGPEERFDFVFDQFTKDPAVPLMTARPKVPVSRTAPPAASAAPASSTAASAADGDARPGIADRPSMTAVLAPFDPTKLSEPLPSTVPELLRLLSAREEEVGQLLSKGDFGTVFVPAIQAKEIALALEAHADGLTDRRRSEAEAAIMAVVLRAWELDAHGDMGDATKLARTHVAFTAAVRALEAAYARN